MTLSYWLLSETFEYDGEWQTDVSQYSTEQVIGHGLLERHFKVDDQTAQELPTDGSELCDAYGQVFLRPAKVVWVTAFDRNQSYGGPEEGGWWYETGEVIASIPCTTDEEVADAIDRLTKLYGPEFEGNHEYESVLCEGKLGIEVDRKQGVNYPQERPHYE